MKNTIKLIFMALLALAAAACDKTPQPEPEPKPEPKPEPEVVLNEDIKFTFEVVSVEVNTAKIKISHDGTSSDTWYGFATTNSNVTKAITEKHAELTAAGNIKGLRKQTSFTDTINELAPETEYTYIAFGITADGTLYGQPASIKFTTEREAGKIEETDTWTITYDGRGENQGEEVELFSIECEKGNQYYFTTVSDYILEANKLEVADYVKYVIDQEIPMLLSYGYKISDLVLSESMTLAAARMESGDYHGLAIGFNNKGEATGYYSANAFTIEEEAAEDAYNQWLGTWELTDATGDNKFEITIHHYDNNFMYALTGWECGSHMPVDFTEALGETIVFPLTYKDGKAYFKEYGITYLSASAASNKEELYFGLWGWGDLTYGGKTYENTLIGYEGAEMAAAETTDSQNGTISGLYFSDGQYDITYKAMSFAGIAIVQGIQSSYWNNPMEFPISMVKKEGSAIQQQSMSMPIYMNTDLKATSSKKVEKMPFSIINL